MSLSWLAHLLQRLAAAAAYFTFHSLIHHIDPSPADFFYSSQSPSLEKTILKAQVSIGFRPPFPPYQIEPVNHGPQAPCGTSRAPGHQCGTAMASNGCWWPSPPAKSTRRRWALSMASRRRTARTVGPGRGRRDRRLEDLGTWTDAQVVSGQTQLGNMCGMDIGLRMGL